MPKEVPQKRISRRDSLSFLAKAGEFLVAAKESFDLELHSAATSNAVHAGISASDAITGFRRGYRATGQDHRQVLDLLRTVPEGHAAVADLAALLKVKPKAEYDPAPLTKSAAASAIRRAAHLLDLAQRVATSTH